MIKGTVPLQQNKGSRISRVVIHRGESLKKKNYYLQISEIVVVVGRGSNELGEGQSSVLGHK